MSPLYRNRETGIIQSHPVSGIGDDLNSDEVGEDSKPVIPLGASDDEKKRLLKLAEDLDKAAKLEAKQAADAANTDTKDKS